MVLALLLLLRLLCSRWQAYWQGVGFTVAEHAPSRSYFLTGVSELLATLDEHAVATQTLLLSPYRGPLEDRLRRRVTRMPPPTAPPPRVCSARVHSHRALFGPAMRP